MKKFPIHLCQPDNKKSCAACCGLYNFKLNDRQHTIERLRRNTLIFFQNSQEDITKVIKHHSSLYRAKDNGAEKCFQTLFNCEFVGFIDGSERRVGCLLHPQLNNGADFRVHSFYGDRLCEEHYCLSYYYLSLQEQLLVINVVKDWYLYGLTITDIDLVKATYQVLSDKLGEGLNIDLISRSQELSSLLLRFFEFKLDWPFKALGDNRFGKYIFDSDGYREISINYKKFHRNRSPFHAFFKAYSSEFKNGFEIDEAEKLLAKLVDRFCSVYAIQNKECK